MDRPDERRKLMKAAIIKAGGKLPDDLKDEGEDEYGQPL